MKKPLAEVPNMIVDSLQEELAARYPELKAEKLLTDCMLRCVEGKPGAEGVSGIGCGHFPVLFISLPKAYPTPKQVKPKLSTAISPDVNKVALVI